MIALVCKVIPKFVVGGAQGPINPRFSASPIRKRRVFIHANVRIHIVFLYKRGRGDRNNFAKLIIGNVNVTRVYFTENRKANIRESVKFLRLVTSY